MKRYMINGYGRQNLITKLKIILKNKRDAEDYADWLIYTYCDMAGPRRIDETHIIEINKRDVEESIAKEYCFYHLDKDCELDLIDID